MMMKKNKIKILLWISAIVLAITTFFVFKDTFALFETNAYGVANSDIGRWVIRLSNQTITSGLDEDLEIDNFNYQTVSTVAPNRIAPGTSAYFDLVFDATDCDVAVRYDIEFKVDEIDYEENIGLSVEALDDSNTIRTDENTYSGVITLASIANDDVVTIRVSLDWDDIAQYNESDTALGEVAGNSLVIPISVHAEQYLGETLVPYVGE